MNEKRKLRPKYIVHKLSEHGVALSATKKEATDPDDVDSPFVLMPRKDPAAFVAMIAYAEHCETDLADEIEAWLRTIVEADPIFGTQGARNFKAARLKIVQNML